MYPKNMKKVILALALLTFISSAEFSCTRAKPGCKKNIKKVKKMRKEGRINM
jgi:hypothetical protein